MSVTSCADDELGPLVHRVIRVAVGRELDGIDVLLPVTSVTSTLTEFTAAHRACYGSIHVRRSTSSVTSRT